MRDKRKDTDKQDETTQQAEEVLEAQDENSVPENDSAGEASEKNEFELLQEQFNDLNDKYLRLMAEYDNFRKRSQKEKDDIYPSATAAALIKFLPVLDNLDRAAEYDYNTEDFAKGFNMICQNFKEIMESFGVEEVGQVGETFDPNFHNAAMHIEDDSLGTNVISQVFQKGYKIGDRVIRYAMVQTAN